MDAALQYARKIALLSLGAAFLLLGIAGLALPFLQGILFIALGIILITSASTRVRAWVGKYTRRYPRLHHAIERLRIEAKRLLGL